MGVTPYTELTSLVAKQVSPGPVKRAICTDFVAKIYSWEIKRATSLSVDQFCGNVVKQAARSCCPFHLFLIDLCVTSSLCFTQLVFLFLFPFYSFNQLDLPAYETYDKLRSMLNKAVDECPEGFGLA